MSDLTIGSTAPTESPTIYRNADFRRRDYDCSNVVACVAYHKPTVGNWIECEASVLEGLTMLERRADVFYYGWL